MAHNTARRHAAYMKRQRKEDKKRAKEATNAATALLMIPLWIIGGIFKGFGKIFRSIWNISVNYPILIVKKIIEQIK